jgi:Uma2 family endonuclease
VSPVTRKPLATAADIAHRPDRDRLEIIHGVIIEKDSPMSASPRPRHAIAQVRLCSWLDRRFSRRNPGQAGPGGWWIMSEIHVAYASGELYCHDVAGWRRERTDDEMLSSTQVEVRPDWVCEILSDAHAKHDLVNKPLVLHRAGVQHYWILDPDEKQLLVYRHADLGYLNILSASSEEMVRAEPFDAVDLKVAVLFGDEDDD